MTHPLDDPRIRALHDAVHEYLHACFEDRGRHTTATALRDAVNALPELVALEVGAVTVAGTPYVHLCVRDDREARLLVVCDDLLTDALALAGRPFEHARFDAVPTDEADAEALFRGRVAVLAVGRPSPRLHALAHIAAMARTPFHHAYGKGDIIEGLIALDGAVHLRRMCTPP